MHQYIDALLHQKRRVEDNQAIAQRQYIVAGSYLEKGSDRTLYNTKIPSANRISKPVG